MSIVHSSGDVSITNSATVGGTLSVTNSVSIGNSLTWGGVTWRAPPVGSGGTWPHLIGCTADGVSEIAAVLDFHPTNSATGEDYHVRLAAHAPGALSCTGSFACEGTVTRLQHHTLAHQAAALSVAPQTWTTLTLGVTRNVRGTSLYNAAQNRFVVPVAGLYIVNASWSTFSSLPILTRLTKNGVVESQEYTGQLQHVVYLGTADFVQVQVFHSESAAQAVFTDWQVTRVTLTQL